MKTSIVNVLGAFPTIRVSRAWGNSETGVLIFDKESVVQFELSDDAVNNLIKKLQWAKKMIKEGN